MPFLLSLVLALTQPASTQIRNPEQVRIACSCDPRPGTLISTGQLSDGRYVSTDSTGALTICIVVWERVTYEDGTGFNYHSPVCYTQAGLSLLLTSPAWKSWWDSHQP